MGKETGRRGEHMRSKTSGEQVAAVSRTVKNNSNAFKPNDGDIYEGMKASQWLPTTKRKPRSEGGTNLM